VIDAGFGLGLSIVKRLADLLTSASTWTPAPGAGTTFRLHLAAVPRRCESASGRGPRAWKRLHVLVVDDEGHVRRGMQTLSKGWVAARRSSTGRRKAVGGGAGRLA
jgi:hypothetical protein